MRALTDKELERMRRAAEEAMFDRCRILRYRAGARDAHGMPQATWAEGEELPCGFRTLSAREALDGAQVPLADAELRLPWDAELSNLDRVRLSARHGEALAEGPLYEVVGLPVRGPSALVVRLRRV
jgi:hypothetical protein